MKMIKYSAILLLMLTSFQIALGQKHTMEWEEGMTSPEMQLADVAWIAGHWKGEAFGGIAEEVWTPPMGESMMFVFKLVAEGKVVFYEVGHIKQVDKTLFMQLKHFDGALKGWETKDETVDFKLIKAEENKVFFDGLTFEKISDNAMDVYVIVEDKGKKEEIKFSYKK